VKLLNVSSEIIHLTNMRRDAIGRALVNALSEKYPNATMNEPDREGHIEKADIVLHLPDERVAFEVKTSNFYDGLGRAVLLARRYNGAYLVVPHQLLPSQDILHLIPNDVGIVSFQLQDNTIRFDVVRQSGNQKLTSFTSTVDESMIMSAKPGKVSLVSTKALRIVRHLVAHKSTTQIQLARDTQVSVGMVNKVVSALVDRDLVSYRGKKLVVFDVWKLLNEVSWNRPLRSLKKMDVQLSHVTSVQEAEAELAKICVRKKMKYALTLFSGASRYIGYGMKYDSIQTYVDQPELLLDEQDRKQSDGVLLEVYGIDTPDVIDESRIIGGLVVCSPSQVVVDLVSYGHVGRDWAVKLYEATLDKGEKNDDRLVR